MKKMGFKTIQSAASFSLVEEVNLGVNLNTFKMANSFSKGTEEKIGEMYMEEILHVGE